MRSTMLLTRAELTRLTRNKRYLLFTLLLPVVLYVALGRTKTSAYGTGFNAFYMVTMATMGAFSGALMGNAQRIAQERKEGWIRQLRLTSLPANAYVVGKIVASMAVTLPSVLIVLLLGRFYGGVHLALWQWAAIAVTIWLGSTIFAALAVAIGFRFAPDQTQAVAMLVYFGFAIFGGLWFSLGGGMQKFGDALPTYQVVKIGTDVITGTAVPAWLGFGLAAWLTVFAGLATLAVRSTAETI